MYLFGASGHGKVIKEIIEAGGQEVDAFVDDNPNINELCGKKVLHTRMGVSPIIISIGVNQNRKMIAEQLLAYNPNIKFGIAIHPSAVVSPSAKKER